MANALSNKLSNKSASQSVLHFVQLDPRPNRPDQFARSPAGPLARSPAPRRSAAAPPGSDPALAWPDPTDAAARPDPLARATIIKQALRLAHAFH